MSATIELVEELKERIDRRLKEDQTYEQFIQELVNHYETEGGSSERDTLVNHKRTGANSTVGSSY